MEGRTWEYVSSVMNRTGAKSLADDLRILTSEQQERGVCMPQRVRSDRGW